MERADGLVQLSTSSAELIEQLVVALAGFASERNVELRLSTELMASVESVRESLGNASERLSEIQQSSGRDSPETGTWRSISPQIMKLSLGIVAKLDVVQDQIAEFRWPSRRNEASTQSTTQQATVLGFSAVSS